MKKVLVVIDAQNDFITGSLGSSEAQAVVPKICDKIRNFLQSEECEGLYLTMDTHDENYLNTPEGKQLSIKHCIRNTDGHLINNRILQTLIYSNKCLLQVIEKDKFGADQLISRLDTDINELGNKIDQIEIVGLCTDICVLMNAMLLKNAFPNIKIVVDSTCCAGSTPEKHKAAIEIMKACQIIVIEELTEYEKICVDLHHINKVVDEVEKKNVARLAVKIPQKHEKLETCNVNDFAALMGSFINN